MMKEYQALPLPIIETYKDCGVEHKLLVSAAYEGMCLAAKYYDSSSGVKFEAYAVWWIKSSIEERINGKNNE